jgi:GT2 family glycosyltransferase
MAEAFRQGFDAAWLLDDDGAPSETCLANLVEAGKRTVIGFATPLVVNENNPDELVFGLTVSGRFVRSTEAAVATANSDGIIDDAINPFNGSLISRDTYRRLGDLKFECFLWGEDLDYVERARASNIKIGTVASARYHHPTTKDQRIKFGPLQTDLQLYPPVRSHFYFRNIGFIKAHHRGIINAAYHCTNYLCFLLTTLQFVESWKFICYYLDGAFDLYLLKPSRSTLCQLQKQVSRVDLTSAIEREHIISK